MKKIVLVCPYNFNRFGGVRTHILDLATALQNKGHSVVIVACFNERNESLVGCAKTFFKGLYNTFFNSSTSPSYYRKMHFVNRIECLDIGYSSRFKFHSTVIDFVSASDEDKQVFLDFMRDYEPDVIHFHTPWNPILCWQILGWIYTSKGMKVRKVATFHDSPPNPSSITGKYIMPLAARYVCRLFDKVVSVSTFQRSFISKYTNQQIDVIPNGIFLENKDSKSENEVITEHKATAEVSSSEEVLKSILFIGRLEERKGILDMLQVYSLISFVKPECELWICGDGPYMSKVIELSQHSKFASKIKIYGEVSEETKVKLIKECTVFVSPALYGESFGIVLLEAMKYNKKIAGYANPGYMCVVGGVCEENFAPCGHFMRLTDICLELLEDDRKVDYKSILEQYDWNKISETLLATVYIDKKRKSNKRSFLQLCEN